MHSSVLLFLNIGTPELMLIFLVALMLFGGDKLPGLARGLGRGIREFKDASEDVKREINRQINTFDEVARDKKTDEPEVPAATEAVESIAEEKNEADIAELKHAEAENLEASNIVNNTEAAATADAAAADETTEDSAKPVFTKPANTIEYKG